MTKIKIKAADVGRKRTAPARISARQGKAVIECPFCFPPHAIVVGQTSKCGTTLELRAIQRIYTVAKCAKCGGSKGTFVKIGDHYQHSVECAPGKVLMAEDPKPSRSAGFVYHMPQFLRSFISNRRGEIASRLQSEGKKPVYTWMKI